MDIIPGTVKNCTSKEHGERSILKEIILAASAANEIQKDKSGIKQPT